MRKRFEQQLTIGSIPISEVKITTKKRSGALPGLCAALKEIFITPKWNEKVFEMLEKQIFSKNNNTGRPGMDLWHMFVLSQVRLCQNIGYDDLHHIANYDGLIRQIMGIERGFGYERYEFGYQSIIDNIGLLTDDNVKELNSIIVDFGHETFKKKEAAALCLKTDSFVVESNVHFPTDYNLLWDSARKSLDMVSKFQEKYKLPGWRKINDWRCSLKNNMRHLVKPAHQEEKAKRTGSKKLHRNILPKLKHCMPNLKKTKPAFLNPISLML